MSVPAVTAPFAAASLVLAVAGAAKLWRPDDTARALYVAGLPHDRRLVRAGAAAEIAVAAGAVASPGPLTAALVSAAYAAFALFVAAALVKGWPLSSCGCFGRPDARPGYPHLVLNVAAAVAAAWWAAVAPGRGSGAGLAGLFVQTPWRGGPLALVTAVVAGLAYQVWTNPMERGRA